MERFVLYQNQVAIENNNNLIFLDEFGCQQNMALPYGWAPEGQRALAWKPTDHGVSINTIGALSTSGLLTAMSFADTMHGGVYAFFVQHFLLNFLHPGIIVIADNARPHYDQDALEMIAQTGAKMLFLPPYRPELNPIENAWSVIKHKIKKIAARTKDSLYQAIADALKLIDQKQALAFFKHCGYSSN